MQGLKLGSSLTSSVAVAQVAEQMGKEKLQRCSETGPEMGLLVQSSAHTSICNLPYLTLGLPVGHLGQLTFTCREVKFTLLRRPYLSNGR